MTVDDTDVEIVTLIVCIMGCLDDDPVRLKNLRGLTQLFVMGGTADSGIVSARGAGLEASTIAVDMKMISHQTTEITTLEEF